MLKSRENSNVARTCEASEWKFHSVNSKLAAEMATIRPAMRAWMVKGGKNTFRNQLPHNGSPNLQSIPHSN